MSGDVIRFTIVGNGGDLGRRHRVELFITYDAIVSCDGVAAKRRRLRRGRRAGRR